MNKEQEAELTSAVPVSSESLPGFWQEFMAGLGREGFTEYEFDSGELRSQAAERAKKAYESALANIFKELKTKDPEVVAAALEIWGCRRCR